MTSRGAQALQEELIRRRQVDRRAITEAIAEARAHGDLKENAEYHAAREQQSFNEGRIHEIEAKLANAQVIDVARLPNHGKVIFGASVCLLELATERALAYMIVGEDEANVQENKISFNSPIARAIIGKEVGDVVLVRTPKGDIEYEISEVEYL